MTKMTAKYFKDADEARRHLESIRWPDGPICPHCGGFERIHKVAGKSHRAGLYACRDCNGHFTVTVGTVFERSKIPLNVWFQAVYLLCCSKKGMSSKQLERMLGVTYKTAWFMTHRIREAMREGTFGPMGGAGKIVEADETFIGGKEKNKHVGQRKRGNLGGKGKEAVLSLVERDGKVRSQHVPDVSAKTLRPILNAQIEKNSFLVTDGEGQYRIIGPDFAKHETVNHSINEYVRGDVHTNTVEGYFSILKRGITGTYHHVSQAHLKRYLGEFDFRYNYREALGYDDLARTTQALKGIEGKRLTYGGPAAAKA